MSQTIIGVFRSFGQANGVVQRLVNAGISREHIEVHGRDADATAGSPGVADSDDRSFMEKIRQFFSNIFGDDEHREEVGNYSEAVRRGGALVSVEVVDGAQSGTVRALMEEEGAVDIDTQVATWRSGGYTGFDPNAPIYSREEAEAERQSIPVVQEDLVVGKREVDTGRVRVYSRSTSTPVTESVDLREERANIERRPVDREATAADLQGGTVEVRETAEEAVVGKKSRVVEEVVVGKQSSERTETINETVRGTEVEVERVDGEKARRDTSGTVKPPEQ